MGEREKNQQYYIQQKTSFFGEKKNSSINTQLMKKLKHANIDMQHTSTNSIHNEIFSSLQWLIFAFPYRWLHINRIFFLFRVLMIRENQSRTNNSNAPQPPNRVHVCMLMLMLMHSLIDLPRTLELHSGFVVLWASSIHIS